MKSTNQEVTTLSGRPITGETTKIEPSTGMQKDYVVLTAEERAKGFVRPVRRSYIHTGIRPKHPIRMLTDEEKEHYKEYGFIAYEEYPQNPGSSLTGRYWTRAQLESGCGKVTTMGQELAETYARDPHFYGGTFCAHCRTHFPVGESGEFVWEEGGERVGT